MIRKISLSVMFAVVMLVPSFCRAGTNAGDFYFNGVGLAAQGKLEEAKAEFQKSLDDDSVYAYAKLEIHAIDDVLKQKIKKETAILVFQGKELATQKKWQEAINLYNKAIKENPNYGYAFISKGIAYMSQGELDKAISCFSDSINCCPQFTEAYQNRGVLLEYKGQFNKAIADFDKAIAADPNSYVLYFNRGMARVYKNQCDLALPDLEKAIELKPNYAKAYINKGVALEDLKRNDEAIAAYKKAIELDASQDKEIAKDAEASIRALEAERKKLEYAPQLKALVKQAEEVREKEELADPPTTGDSTAVKEISFYISITDMNIPVKASYNFYDFGLAVDDKLVIKKFVQTTTDLSKTALKTVNSAPAEYSGMRIGDRLLSINGKSIVGFSPGEAERFIGSHRYIRVTVARH